MSIPSKSPRLAFATALVVSVMIVVAVSQADPNPYGLEDELKKEKFSLNAANILAATDSLQRTELVAPRITDPGARLNVDRLRVPGGKLGIPGGANQSFVKQDGPIFVKSGGKLGNPGIANQSFAEEGPIFVEAGSVKLGDKIIPDAGQLRKSAVEAVKQLRAQ